MNPKVKKKKNLRSWTYHLNFPSLNFLIYTSGNNNAYM
jgi:hypothetical protein